ncbi:MAG: penicillin-binding protein 2 [Candidatus Paceibacterota bacterium]|jgi:cell division protein FtsI/penicillin-binding protein 2
MMTPLSGLINKQFAWRSNVLVVIIYVFGILILGRLFVLTVIKHDIYQNQAENQKNLSIIQRTKRGEIYFDNKGELFSAAINKQWPMVYAEPSRIKTDQRKNIATELSKILNISEDEILKKISDPKDPFELIKNKLSETEISAIAKLNINGIKTKNDEIRYYPGGKLASHVVGFLGYSGDNRIGQYGIEEYYEKSLSQEKMAENIGNDPNVNLTGENLVLSIDSNIQLFVEEELEKTVKTYNASEGTVIIMEPKTGKIMAMANYPNFDLNEYAKVNNLDVLVNSAISTVYEPGSVFKPLIMAMALDQWKINPLTTYNDTGSVKIGGYTVYNADKKQYGVQTMTQVLEKSLNTGVIYVEKLLDQSLIKQYYKNFGIGEKTGIDLAGEASGNMNNLDSGRDINFATAAFGQGISVTPLQLLRAIGAIANNGIIVKPYIVERIFKNDNIQEDVIDYASSSKRIIFPETSNYLTSMLVSVTENGTGRKAKIPGYWIALKTGTAQIPSKENGGYSSDETIHTIVGFAPAYNPRFIILAKVDRPQGVRFAEGSVTPLFRNIAEYLLGYLEISPER